MGSRSLVCALLLLASGCEFNGSNGSLLGDAGDNDVRGLADARAAGDARSGDAGEGNVDAAPGDADAAPGDADASPGAADAAPGCPGDDLPFAPINFDGCAILAPAGNLQASGAGTYVIDTDTGILERPNGSATTLPFVVQSQASGPELFIVSVSDFVLGPNSRLEIAGARPLVLVSFDDAEVRGVLFVGPRDGEAGPGGDLDGACVSGRGQPGSTQSAGGGDDGGSGGGGGGFGGDGGAGAIVDGSSGATTEGGASQGSAALTPLRGGCAGGSGGAGGGGAGQAAGAIQIVAADQILVEGAIAAPGGAGRASAAASGGGGGGGSGGAILLHASAVDISGAVTANGGGGGEGASSSGVPDDGDPGALDSDTPASGGAGLSAGGDGGDGGAGGSSAGNGQSGSSGVTGAAGGGGGGGGVGRVRIESVAPAVIGTSATISPAAQ